VSCLYLYASRLALHTPMTTLLRPQPRHGVEIRERPCADSDGIAQLWSRFRVRERERDVASTHIMNY
jgi:hypothetical protein